MLYDAVEDAHARSPRELREAYAAELGEVVGTVGPDAVAESTEIEPATAEALADGDLPDLTLEEATAVLATAPEAPDAETIVLEIRDHLLLGMTTGVLDVDTVAAESDTDLSGQEIQQSLEGRRSTSLAELAAIHSVIAGHNG